MAVRNFSQWGGRELTFLLQELDFPTIAEHFGFERIQSESIRRSNGSYAQWYGRDGVGRKISIGMGKKSNIPTFSIVNGFEGGDIREFVGMASKLIEPKQKTDKRSSYPAEVYKKLRELAIQFEGIKYALFVEAFVRENGPESVPSNTLKLINLKQEKPVQNKPAQSKLAPAEEKEIREFKYEPASDFSFLIDRGITMETINNPLFVGMFGNSFGGFAAETLDKARINPDRLKFGSHFLVPYKDENGRVISLEAKNKYTEEGFEAAVLSAIRKGDSISDVRRNPSLLYAGSSKSTGLCISNIPEKPTQIFVSEQPANFLAYYQLNHNTLPLDSTIFVSTGGSLSDGQLDQIQSLATKHNISKIHSGFDNDLPGLLYSLKLNKRFSEREPDKPMLSFMNRGKSHLILSISNPNDQRPNRKKDEEEIEKLNSLLTRLMPGNRPIEYIKSMTSGGSIYTAHIPFQPGIFESVHKVFSEYNKPTSEIVVSVSKDSKDWNDQLLGKEHTPLNQSVHLFDQKSEKGKVFIDEFARVILQQRMFDAKQSNREHIGSINPYAYNNRVAPVKSILQTNEARNLIEEVKKELKGVPLLKDDWLYAQTHQGIKYHPVLREFTKKNGSVLARLDENSNPVFENVKYTSKEQAAVLAMSALVREGYEPNNPVLSIKYDKVILNNIATDPLFFNQEKNEVIYFKPLANIIAGKGVNESSQWSILPEVSNSIPKEQLQELEKRVVEDYDHFIQTGYTNKDSEFSFKDDTVFQRVPLAKVEGGKIVLLDQNADIPEDIFDGLERIQKDITDGRDPNKRELLGTITQDYVFKPAKGIKLSQLPVHQNLQLSNLKLGLDDARQAFIAFKAKYHEPLYEISSKDMVLSYNFQPLFMFDRQTDTLKPLLTQEEFSRRSFHPSFTKALSLFIANKGVYNNYISNIKVNPQSKNIFFNSEDYVIGQFFKHTDGKAYYYLFDSVPKDIVRELELFSPMPKASRDLITELKFNTDLSTNVKQKKDKWHETIPHNYRLFYDYNTKRFKPKSEEEIAKLHPTMRALYSEAQFWHLTNADKSIQKEKTPDWVEENGVLKYKSLPYLEYDPVNDKLIYHIQPTVKFYPNVAAFELRHVKDPSNREYSKYLTKDSIAEPVKVTHEDKIKMLAMIEIEDSSQKVYAKSNNERIMEIGYFTNSEGVKVLNINKTFSEVTPAFIPAIELYADAINAKSKGSIRVNWFEQELNEQKIVKAEISEIKVANVNPTVKYDHNLLLTDGKVLTTLIHSPIFNKEVIIADNQVNFKFKKDAEGNQLILPLGHDYSLIKEKQVWYSGNTLNPSSITVAQSPDQALMLGQYFLSEALENKTMYISSLNFTKTAQKQLVTDAYKAYQVNSIQIIGDDNFIEDQRAILDGLNITRTVPSIAPDQAIEKLLSGDKGLGKYQPDEKLQAVIDDIKGHNIINPARGLAIFPINDGQATHSIVVGKLVNFSSLSDGMFFSKNPALSKKFVLTHDPMEALYFMSLNKDHLEGACVVVFQGKVTTNQVQRLETMFNQKRYEGKIEVANSYKLQETLSAKGLTIPTKILTPFQCPTFQEEHKAEFELTTVKESRINQPVTISVGKHNAPALSKVRTQEQSKNELSTPSRS